jgi:hypothetical protein
VQPRGLRVLGDRRLGGHHVEAVEASGPDVQFGDAAGLPDAGGVGDVLVAEGLSRADVDERWGQP